MMIHREERLVPTRVGMILLAAMLMKKAMTCPHTRGDDPGLGLTYEIVLSLSPHAWG